MNQFKKNAAVCEETTLLKTWAKKNNQFRTEISIILEYLKENTVTASMLSEVTGIKQKNICRYKRQLEQKGLVKELFRTNCKITGFKAWYLTANIKSSEISSQFELFDFNFCA